VTLVASAESAAALALRGGVELQGRDAGLYPVAVTTNLALADAAVVVVAVKAYDLQAALARLVPHLNARHEVVVLQNGLGIGAAAQRTVGRACVRGVTFLAAERVARGVVRYNAVGKTYLPRGAAAVELWRAGDLPVEPVDAILRYEWRKVAINAVINPLSALLDVENGRLQPLVAAAQSLVAELVAVAARDGCELDAGETLDKILASMRQTARNPSSMLQDVRAGRPTEIDWINGAIVHLGERYGVPTPQHRLLCEMVRFKAAHAANGTRCESEPSRSSRSSC
jgi:2-dehydropantoate 2-reductase